MANERDSDNDNGRYIKVPKWLAPTIVSVVLALLTAYFSTVIGNVENAVADSKQEQQKQEERIRILENNVGVINTKLDGIKDSQDKTDKKIDELIKEIKK